MSQQLVYLRGDTLGLKTSVLASNNLRELKRKVTALAGKNTAAVTLFRPLGSATNDTEEADHRLLLNDLRFSPVAGKDVEEGTAYEEGSTLTNTTVVSCFGVQFRRLR